MFFSLLMMLAVAKDSHKERPIDAPVPVPALAADASESVRRGAELYRTASCVGCHSPPFADAQHLGGGRDLPTDFGVFYAPNISPDPVYGIGQWTEEDFIRAMRKGKSPEGKSYWPTFPYMAYTKMTDADLMDLWAYLQVGAPVQTESKKHQVKAAYRFPGALGMWRRMNLKTGALASDPTLSKEANRGRYLVQAVSYCDQCHTPRSKLGKLKKAYYLAGGANPGKADVHPNLTPNKEVGIGRWSREQIATYLATGVKFDRMGTDPKNIMYEKIHDSFSVYSFPDRLAIAAYLKTLEPSDFDPQSLVK